MKCDHSHFGCGLIFAMVFAATSGFSQTSLYYKHISGGSWNTASNWTPNDVPSEATEHAFIGTGSELDTDAVRVNFNVSNSPIIYGLSIGTGSRLNYINNMATGALTISNVLDNDGRIWLLAPNSNTRTHTLAYNGSSFSESSGSFTIDHNSLNSASRISQLQLASGNTNNSTITMINRSDSTSPFNQANLLLVGLGVFINQKTVAILNATPASSARAAGENTTYRQVGASAKTLIGALLTSTASTANNAEMTMAAIAVGDGEFVGNGCVIAPGGFSVGNNDGVQAVLRVNPLTVAGSSNGSASDAAVGEDDEIATMTVGASGIQQTALTLNSDSVLELQLNLLTESADRVDVFGDVTISAGAQLSVSLFRIDVVLAEGTRFKLITYSGRLTGAFAGLEDGAVFNVGRNSYRIDYDGNFATGDFMGGKDVMLTAVSAIPEPSAFKDRAGGTVLLGAVGLSSP